MRHKSKNKTRPLFTLSLEMTRLVKETRLLLVPGFNSDIYGSLFQLTSFLCESRLLMTFTKFNEFSYATIGALYMVSSHAQLALCLSVLYTFFYLVYGLPKKCSSFMAASWD